MAYKSFTVYGAGVFPFDMLRYDECFPYSIEDAIKLDAGFDETSLRSRRLVRLVSHNRNAPTEKRWNSFGWQIMAEQGLSSLAT